MRFAEIVTASADVAATRSRLAKIERLAAVIRGLEEPERVPGLLYLAGRPRQDTLGVGWAALDKLDLDVTPVAHLSVADVDAALEAVAGVSGAGAGSRRTELLTTLLAEATPAEQEFLQRLILRQLRQGASDGLLIEAIAVAAEVTPAAVRRAAMLSGDLAGVGAAALAGGTAALTAFRLEVGRPVQPMLAQSAPGIADALAAVGGVGSVEVKLDGARVQVHKRGTDVRVFTRNLRDVTARLPEVVATVGSLGFRDLILDGEVVGLDAGGRPLPFQVTMARFATEAPDSPQVPGISEEPAAPDGGDEAHGAAPVLTPVFFDILHIDGVDLLDAPATERWQALSRLPESLVVGRMVADTPESAEAFLDVSLRDGHEGVMVKSLDAPYEAGRRGAAWRKVKPTHTLELVVLAAEWGSGRRRGLLSNLHLGARNPDGGFVMLGKTFKGLTDAMLAWQTARFLELETHRTGHVVHVRPEVVVEIAFDGVQASSRYPGGVTLRFARVRGFRPDRSAADADTIGTVQRIHRGEMLPRSVDP